MSDNIIIFASLKGSVDATRAAGWTDLGRERPPFFSSKKLPCFRKYMCKIDRIITVCAKCFRLMQIVNSCMMSCRNYSKRKRATIFSFQEKAWKFYRCEYFPSIEKPSDKDKLIEKSRVIHKCILSEMLRIFKSR